MPVYGDVETINLCMMGCGALIGQVVELQVAASLALYARPYPYTIPKSHENKSTCAPLCNNYFTNTHIPDDDDDDVVLPVAMSQPSSPAQPASPALSDDGQAEAPLTMEASTLLTTLPTDTKQALATAGRLNVEKGKCAASFITTTALPHVLHQHTPLPSPPP